MRIGLVGCVKSKATPARAEDLYTSPLFRGARRSVELGPDLSEHVFELHAGSAYLDHGLAEGIERRGGRVERPLDGLSQGRRLAFYKERGCL
ncbi:MAG TPA: hypothetical protein VNO79_07330 [Actinomycetota bacterium]|nr:hypothetical protein [Actinomycetota bacterium]